MNRILRLALAVLPLLLVTVVWIGRRSAAPTLASAVFPERELPSAEANERAVERVLVRDVARGVPDRVDDRPARVPAGVADAPIARGEGASATIHVSSYDVGPAFAWSGLVDVFDENSLLQHVGLARSGDVALIDLPRRSLRVAVFVAGFERAEQDFTPGTADSPASVDVVVRTQPRLTMRLECAPGQALMEVRDPRLAGVASRLRPFLSTKRPVVGEPLDPVDTSIRARREIPRDPRAGAWHDFVLEEWRSGYCGVLLGSRVLDAQPFDAGQHVVTCTVSLESLAASTGSVRARLLNEHGQPMVGVHVWVRSDDAATVETWSDDRGECRFDGVSPGPIEVRVVPKGQPMLEIARKLAPGGTADLGDVIVDDGITLRGNLDVSNSSDLRIRVICRRVDSPTFERFTFSISSNDFEFRGLPRAEYMVGCTGIQPPPRADDVRRGLVEGWSIVDLTRGEIAPFVLHVPAPKIVRGSFGTDVDDDAQWADYEE